MKLWNVTFEKMMQNEREISRAKKNEVQDVASRLIASINDA